MISNRELAESYLEDAEYSFIEAEEAYKRGFYHRVVRRCQECVELSLKAVLRLYGVEYPRAHDVSGVLMRMSERLPEWFKMKLEMISDVSVMLVMQMAPSFYGDELRRLPPKGIYDKEGAKRVLDLTKQVLDLVRRLMLEWF